MFKSGFVAILGRANVGKSTLINSIVGEKISGTTEKPQTTRHKIVGIYNSEDSQIVILDTPGLHKPKHKLGEYMMKSAEKAIEDVDLILYVTDNDFSLSKLEKYKNFLTNNEAKVFAVINKTDIISLPNFDFIKKQLESKDYIDKIFGVSALSGRGIKELIETIKEYLPEGPKYYPDNMYTEETERDICSEIIREKILMYMDEEIPHGVAVSVEKFRKRRTKDIVDIEADIICEKSSHKGMLIGKNGRKLKGIGSSARKDIEEYFGIKVNLKLWVKVKPDWRNDESEMKKQGYDLGRV